MLILLIYCNKIIKSQFNVYNMVLYLLAHFFKASTLKVPWLSEWLVLLNQTLYSSLFNSDWGSIRVFLQPIAQSEYLLFFHDYFIGFWYVIQICSHWNWWNEFINSCSKLSISILLTVALYTILLSMSNMTSRYWLSSWKYFIWRT